MKFIDKPSPNFNDRKTEVKYLVMHFTGMKSLPEVIDRLRDPAAEVSAHYLIDEDGNIYRMVDEGKRAWHAGTSSWQGERDMNSASIGIEIQNNGDKPFAAAQIDALIALSRDIMKRHNIAPENVVGHSDIAPDRKVDPGPHFPWRRLAAHGIGRYPEPNLRDRFNAAAAARNPQRLRKLFARAGDGVDAFGKDSPTLQELTAAFQSRYQPHVFSTPGKIGRADAQTVSLLRAVARQQRAAGGKRRP